MTDEEDYTFDVLEAYKYDHTWSLHVSLSCMICINAPHTCLMSTCHYPVLCTDSYSSVICKPCTYISTYCLLGCVAHIFCTEQMYTESDMQQ
jgi:hypothetical protein